MSELFSVGVGNVLSADIAVPEHEREFRFYSRVLTTGANPLWREDLMNNLGVPIVGLGARSDAYSDLPVQWMPHIQVADVRASVQRAVNRGGQVLLHHQDADQNSQWAVLKDPAGAAFGIIPVVPKEGLKSMCDGSVGRIGWVDLTVDDASAIRDFYGDVIGWRVADVPMKDGNEPYSDYNMLNSDGSAAAGICHARGVNTDLPPVWLIYLLVGDVEESLRRAEDEGGSVVKAVRRADGEYAFAVIRDPVGAHLAVAPS